MYNVGQTVYCTKSHWQNVNKIALFAPPKEGELVTIVETKMHKGRWWLRFRGQPQMVFYPAKHFRHKYCLFADEVLNNLMVKPC